MSAYFSGVRVFDVNAVINPSKISENSVIALVGTSQNVPDDFPKEENQEAKLNYPYLVTSRSQIKGFDGNLSESLSLIYEQSPAKVVVMKAENTDGYSDAIEACLDISALTGLNPEFLLAPMNESEMKHPSSALKDEALKNFEKLKQVSDQKKDLFDKAKKLSDAKPQDSGLKESMELASEAYKLAKKASDEAKKISDTLSSTTQRYEIVGQKLKSVSEKLDAIAIFDVPEEVTLNDAMPASLQGFWCQPCWPFVQVASSAQAIKSVPMAPLIAGMYVATDRNSGTGGFWETPSNRAVSGILGLEKIVPYRDDDPQCLANLLGAQKITTIIRDGDFKLWNASRGLFDDNDKRWQFIPVVRTWRVIKRMLKDSHKWAVARGIKKNLIEEIEVSATEGIKRLKKMGAVVDGECVRNDEMMTEPEIMEGRLHFLTKFTPVYITQQIHFGLALTNEYLKKGVSK